MCGAEIDPSAPDPSPWRRHIASSLILLHDNAVDEGSDGYIDPRSGLFVFTDAYLRDKGPCCESGCRHCPYQDWVDATG